MQRLAYELRKLRQEAGGLTYREMARRAHYSVTALSQAAAGEQLPSLDLALAYARACGGDAKEWERRWRETDEEVAVRDREDDAMSPYQGLARFESDDHERFFGRRELVDDMRELVRSRRFTAVLGPSGSGKSSLLRAGLIPALRGDGPAGIAAIRILTPGEHPLRTHEEALQPKADGHTEGDTLLVIDQFEEVFTLCRDPEERAGFIDRLLAARQPASRLLVVIAVRADFYGRCAEYRRLADALREASLLVGPMTPAELREVIIRPAQAAGLIVERQLTACLVEKTAREPGGLPLLSHVLQETWRRRRGRALTLQAYEAAGGLHGAIARTAEDVHAGLTPEQTVLARRILLRLVTPGEGTPDTRRPAQREEFDFGDPADTAIVLERLARARLVTLDENMVEIAHEALISAWPRLRQWIDEARERLRLHRQLTEAAHSWNDIGRDPGALYRGTRLTAAEEAFLTPNVTDDLTPLEQGFLTTSAITRRREQQAVARTTRRLRQFTLALSILLVLAVTAGLIAWTQYRLSEQQRHQALTAQRMALSRHLAAESDSLFGTNPDLASLLAVQAYRTSPTKEASASLFAAAALPLRHRLAGHTGSVYAVAFSPDGRTLASSSEDKTVRLWDVATGKLRTTLPIHTGSADPVAFSPDGHTLASGADDGQIRLWDTATSKLRTTLNGHTEAVTSLAFSADGRTLASSSEDKTVKLWDTATDHPHATLNATASVTSVAFSPDGRTLASGGLDEQVQLWDAATGKLRTTLTGHTINVTAVAFDRDGRTVASGGLDGQVQLWDAATGKLRTTLTGHTEAVTSLAFSPDGHTLASSSEDKTVRLWDAATGKLRTTLTGHTGAVTSLAFSADGRTLASSSEDKTVRLWDTATGRPHATLNATGGVTSVAFSPDGRTLASGADDGQIRLWDTATDSPHATLNATASVTSVAFSPDGRTLASGGNDGQIRLWDIATSKLRTTLHTRGVDGHTPGVDSVAFSPDGHTLASGGNDGQIRLWDIATSKLRATLHTRGVDSVAFSPDGRTLASGGLDGTTRLWDVATGKASTTLTGHAGFVYSVAFSPDGRTLASGGLDGTVRLWDVATGKASTTLTGHADVVTSVAFSPDGQTLASGGYDNTVRLWDVGTGGMRYTLRIPGVVSLAFSPDGHTLASGAGDRKVRLWDVSLPGPLSATRKVYQAVHRTFTRSERSKYLV